MTQDEEREANAAAQLAGAGFALHALDDDGRTVWLARKWGLSRELPDLAAVEAFVAWVTTGRRSESPPVCARSGERNTALPTIQPKGPHERDCARGAA